MGWHIPQFLNGTVVVAPITHHRALKTRSKTPKYGLIYNSTFIGRASAKYKGRVSRFLANKCSIASRIDCFTEKPTSKFGEALRKQVDNRIAFYEEGAKPSRNADVIKSVVEELLDEDDMAVDEAPVPATPKKRASEPEAAATESAKKKKKSKKGKDEAVTPVPAEKAAESPVSAKKDKKKKKKKSKD
ncbi:Nucleolar protein 56 [Dimargaris verticillata]|uniref:Nucleolar protein 56 n=1 Tax=Dimargaris verticillata TaxID=2761393 RepID=A0A9W8E5Y6_9FUNG|nr:Nucleolar protein 56 [Dimargaris verticillata]